MTTVVRELREGADKFLMFQSTWRILETVRFKDLTISERAQVIPAEGKEVTLIVDGVVRDIVPGHYTGDVILKVSDAYIIKPEGLMVFNQVEVPTATALCVEDGKVSEEKCIPEAVWGGEISNEKAEGMYVTASAEEINGIVVDNTDYTIRDCKFDFEGFGRNDYAGIGCGVSAYGKSHVNIEDSTFNFSGVTRCAIHASGDSRVHVKNCDILNMSPATDWMGRFCWQIPLRGSNRLCQLSGNARVIYENCRMKTNGWGVLSIDGSDEFVSMTVKDSTMELSGPRSHGYGTFCIGPNEVMIDHSVMDVHGYPMLIMGMEGKGRASIVNGSTVKGRLYGALVVSDSNSIFTIKDSTFDTGKANILVKGSATQIDVENSVMKSGEGVMIRVMDTEECGMNTLNYHVPVGVVDKPIEGRDLTDVAKMNNVLVNLKDMTAEGDILNSTTNIRAYEQSERGGMGKFHDTLVGLVSFTGAAGDEPSEVPGPDPEELRGPKNVGVSLIHAKLTGRVSAATQQHREGVTMITPENWQELNLVEQIPAPAVNNGVVVHVDGKSAWTVTGTSYLTKLTIEDGGVVAAKPGEQLTMFVDGKEMPIAAGTYTGKIELRVG